MRKRNGWRQARIVRGVFLPVLLVCGLFAGGGTRSLAEEPEAPALPEELSQLHALSAVLMDADSGRVLVARDGDTMRPMASTTKIMTCILALEEGDPDGVVTVSARAAAQPKVHLGMREGETFYLRDLLYSLMLESHNDTAFAIAEHLAGSAEQFADRMNEKARELGCRDTHFVTPNGLDGSDGEGAHSISAADLARIMSYCVEHSPRAADFLAITRTQSYSFSDREGERSFSCANHNRFLSMMDGALSGKTGFTGDAGYCYVGALRRDGRTFVAALLGCGWPNNRDYKWEDIRLLMDYGLEHYAYRDVWREVTPADLRVEGGIPGDNELFGTARAGVRLDGGGTSLPVLLADTEQVEVEVEQEQARQAPVRAGEQVGVVRYRLNGEILEEYPLVTEDAVARRDWPWLLDRILERYWKIKINQ